MKKIIFVLICLLVISLTSCSASSNVLDNHIGKWSLKEITMQSGDLSVTINPNDPMYEEDEIPISFIISDGEVEHEMHHYYGKDAKDIKAGDKMLCRVTVVKTASTLTIDAPVKVDKAEGSVKTLEQIKTDADKMEIPEGRWFISYNEYIECTVIEITKPYEMIYYPEDLAIMTLEEDGSGQIVYNFDYLNLGSEKNILNLTWVRYTEEIRITIEGETSRSKIDEEGRLIFEQTLAIAGERYTARCVFLPISN